MPTIEELYQSVLGRAPDAAGAQWWQQQFGTEIDPSEVAAFTQASQPELAGRTSFAGPQSVSTPASQATSYVDPMQWWYDMTPAQQEAYTAKNVANVQSGLAASGMSGIGSNTNLITADNPNGYNTAALEAMQSAGVDTTPMTTAQAVPITKHGGLTRDQVDQLYRKLFGRPADSAGLDYWMDAQAQGVDISNEIAKGARGADIAARDDIAAGTGDTTNAWAGGDANANLAYDATTNKWTSGQYAALTPQQINQQYIKLFGRPAEQAGIDYWMKMSAAHPEWDIMGEIAKGALGQDKVAAADIGAGGVNTGASATGLTGSNWNGDSSGLTWDAVNNKWVQKTGTTRTTGTTGTTAGGGFVNPTPWSTGANTTVGNTNTIVAGSGTNATGGATGALSTRGIWNPMPTIAGGVNTPALDSLYGNMQQRMGAPQPIFDFQGKPNTQVNNDYGMTVDGMGNVVPRVPGLMYKNGGPVGALTKVIKHGL